MDLVELFARLLLAAVFALAGIAKLADRAGSRQAVIDFGLPRGLAAPLGLALPLAEIVVAFLLLPATTAWWGGVGALVLLAAFTVGITYNLARGRSPDCHCFGQLHSKPVGLPTLLRNLVLIGVTLIVVSRGSDTPHPSMIGWWSDLTLSGKLVLAIGLLVVVVFAIQTWFLTQLLAQNGRVLVRLEALEEGQANSPALNPASNGKAAAPPGPQGRPVGAPAPAFELPTAAGGRASLGDLLAPGKLLTLLFMDPKCESCTALLPDVKRWRDSQSDRLEFAILSSGSPKGNRKKFGAEGLPTVLLQEKYEVSELYSALATPSAVVVRPDGRMGSAVATGTDAIRALVSRTIEMPSSQPAPPLRLPDLDGRTVDLKEFQGQETLVLFWNPACGFCERMLPEVKAWEETATSTTPRLLVVSTGTPEANRAIGFRSTVVLENGFGTGQAFGAGGTPSAVLVDAEGRVASGVAMGQPAVMQIAQPIEVGGASVRRDG
jgi:peroxiredoxin